MRNLLDTAIKIATNAHSGQVDKGGEPYILHPLRVMMALKDEKDKIIAVLHDTIEDTDVTYELLRKVGFDEEIIDGIKSVTRNENESYEQFIERVSLNPRGRRVKLADLDDNMNISRIPNPTEKDYRRLEKYERAKRRLSCNYKAETVKSIGELKEIIRTNLNVVFYDDMLIALNNLERYMKLEEQGRLIEFPCRVGDYAEFSDGSVRPVVFLTKSNNGDISIGCQNGHIVSMKHHMGNWVKKFIPKEEYEK